MQGVCIISRIIIDITTQLEKPTMKAFHPAIEYSPLFMFAIYLHRFRANTRRLNSIIIVMYIDSLFKSCWPVIIHILHHAVMWTTSWAVNVSVLASSSSFTKARCDKSIFFIIILFKLKLQWNIPPLILYPILVIKSNFVYFSMRKLTTEEFIKRAREIHGDRYNYDKVIYVNSSTKVIITCYIHGDFEQLPYSHFNKKLPAGCQKCYREASKLTTEEFIKKAIEIHGDRYNYDKVEYIASKFKVIIGCYIHGDFEQTATAHINRKNPHGCQKCYREARKLTTEEFIKRARELHGDKYNYDKVKYINFATKVTIGCYTHGYFKQRAGAHINREVPFGCQKCAQEARKYTTEDFIKKAREIHGDRYNYDKVEYISSQLKVIIGCYIHGDFEQKANAHMRGRGCTECALEKNRDLAGAWSFTAWNERGEISDAFDSYKVYVVLMEKKFYKIGKTFMKLNLRLGQIPLDCEILKVFEFDDGIEASLFEKELHRLCSEYTYIPETEFGGMYECFSSIEPIKDIICEKD